MFKNLVRWLAVAVFVTSGFAWSYMTANIHRDIVAPVQSSSVCHTPEEAAWYLTSAKDQLIGRKWQFEADQLGRLVAQLDLVSPDPGAREFSLRQVQASAKKLLTWESENLPGVISEESMISKYRAGAWLAGIFWAAIILFVATVIPWSQTEESMESELPKPDKPFSLYVQV